MIDTTYVQTLKLQDEINHAYLESVQEIEAITAPVVVANMRKTQEMELGIFTESADEVYTEGVKEAISALGDKIIEIVNRIKEFIKSIPDKIRQATWNKADVDKKMNMIKKEDPKRFETLKVYIDKGMIDFNTFDSMKDFYAGYDELLAELKKKEVNEKSLKGKLEKIKTSINKNEKTIRNVAAALGIVATASTIVYNYMKFRNEGDKYLNNQAEKIADASQQRAREYEKLAKIVESDDIQGTTKASVAAQALAELERETKMNVSKITSFRAAMWKRFDSIATKLSKKVSTIDKANLKKEYSDESARLSTVASFNRSNYNTKVSRQKSVVSPK